MGGRGSGRGKTGNISNRTTGRLEVRKQKEKPKVEKKPEAEVINSGDFNKDLEQAFTELEKQSGNKNYQKLKDLREKLPGYSKEEFDKGVMDLARKRSFGLEQAEGSTVHTSLEDKRKYGIVEKWMKGPHEALMYIRRRD
jgi:hypothetical protein